MKAKGLEAAPPCAAVLENHDTPTCAVLDRLVARRWHTLPESYSMLHEFIAINREEIIIRCRAKAATRSTSPSIEAEIGHGVPVFLDQLSEALRRHLIASPDIATTAIQHGHDLLLQGYTVSQVVHDYGDVCQAITELAVETNAPISTDEFRMLNRCLDDAIAGAVTEFGRGQNRSTLAGETARGNERAGYLAHELRNLLNTATLAFEILKTGNVGVAGSTGTVLHRSLIGARDLIGRSLAEVRLTQGVQNLEQFPVSGFIEELAAAAAMEGDSRRIRLTVVPVDEGAVVEADREILTAAVMNLLQNAFKFTRPQTTVTLRVGASAERVLIEIEDECGGLPGGDVNELFRPFEQRAVDRSGLGLGLAFTRWGVEANRGRLYTRDLPGRGCVFTVDLPRVPVPMLATINRTPPSRRIEVDRDSVDRKHGRGRGDPGANVVRADDRASECGAMPEPSIEGQS